MKKKTIYFIIAFITTLISTAQVTVTTLAGSNYGFADGPGTIAQFHYPFGVATDTSGNVYVADYNNDKIRKITSDGVVSTVAGSTNGFANGNGATAQFSSPHGVVADAAGNLYIADSGNYIIRKITPTGDVSTFAGYGGGFSDGTVDTAQFDLPIGLAIDAAGNMYIADANNYKIRKITPTGIVSTLAGSTHGFADGNGALAQFSGPYGVAVDASGNVYVADSSNNKLRKITSSGEVSTLAGSTQGSADGTGAAAQFFNLSGVAVDAAGTIYVADSGNNKIRKITPSGEVSTLAGTTAGFADGTGTTARFDGPTGVAIDAAGNVYVVDHNNQKIRKITQQLGLAQNYVASKIAISPNPAKETIILKTNQEILINNLSIYNLLGQLVQVNTNPNETIDVSGLKTGSYFIKIVSDKGTVSGKFIKE